MDKVMKFIDQVNRFVVKHLRGNQPAAVLVNDSIVIGNQAFALKDLVGIVANEIDIHAGVLIVLTMTFQDDHEVTITQEDACWPELVSTLDRLALTARPSREWLLELMAGGRQSIILHPPRKIQ